MTKRRAPDLECPKDSTELLRIKMRAIIEFNDAHGIQYFKEDIFRHYRVERSRGYRLLKDESPMRDSTQTPLRRQGRPKAFTDDQVRQMEAIMETEGRLGRRPSWKSLGAAVGLNAATQTISRALCGTVDFRQCLECNQGWVSRSLAERRVLWARQMLARFPTPDHWKQMRFNDVVRFGYGSKEKLQIVPKPGQYHCLDCVGSDAIPEPKLHRHFDCWAAVGYNFKSDLYFYESSHTSDGHLTHQAYVDQILDPVVKPWLVSGQAFLLEEEGDSSHGPRARDNAVKQWKRAHGLQTYVNCGQSPDMSPMRNCWALPAAETVAPPPDENAAKAIIYRAWTGVSQSTINDHVLSMTQRLQTLIDRNGQLTEF